MVSGRDRALMVAIYFYIAWKLLTLSAVVGVASLAFTIALEPAGAFMIPVAAFLGYVGAYAFQRMCAAIEMPYY